MNHRLFWKLCLIIGTGVVVLFYIIDQTIDYIETNMSVIQPQHKLQLQSWSQHAHRLYQANDLIELEHWLTELQKQEQTWAVVASAEVHHIAGNTGRMDEYTGFNLGRSINWNIHLYFKHNPIMELPFSDGSASLLIELPARMRPGSYWDLTRILLQVILPMLILISLSVVLYRHIINPLKELEAATRAFSQGNFEVRVREQLGSRDDELAQLSSTFDHMADHIGDLILRQRQLITDLSHELRTPLTRLDIATENLISAKNKADPVELEQRLERIHRESRHIRKLVDDTLTLSWLENEAPELRTESLDLVDLIEVLVEDATFEYPDRQIDVNLLHSAHIDNSNHRALGQAIENILRNALRYTPAGKTVSIALKKISDRFEISIADQGPGVPEQYLSAIFNPFFRVDASRPAEGASFGLGLALAQRQLKAVAAGVFATNLSNGGLMMSVSVPQN